MRGFPNALVPATENPLRRLAFLSFLYSELRSHRSELIWRYISVALSSRSLALGVTQQVWSFGSPDFPQTSRKTGLQPPAPTFSFYLV